MRFSVIPDHFAPAFAPVIYKIEGGGEENTIDVEVSDTLTGELLGVKRFKGADTVSANVAGYARRKLEPQPQMPAALPEQPSPAAGGFRFSADPGRRAAITVKAGNAVAPPRIFTCALREVNEFEILSKLPLERMLAAGEINEMPTAERDAIPMAEWDEISIAVPDTVLSAEMRVTGDRGLDFTLRTEEFIASRGVATLVIDAADIVDAAFSKPERYEFADCRRAEVKIYAYDELIGRVAYGLYSRSPKQRRICWLNTLGGIDYHTFHSVTEESMAVLKQRIFSAGRYRTVVSEVERSSEIVSGYLTPSLADALAETVSSPRVWMTGRSRDGGPVAVPLDVVTDKTVFRDGELFCLRLTVKEQSAVNRQCL